MKKTVITGAAVLLAAGTSLAAPITWQDSVEMYSVAGNSEAFVDASGTSVLAISGSNDSHSFDVNGVIFQSVDGTTLGTGYTNATSGVSITGSMGSTSGSFGDGSFSSLGDVYDLIGDGFYGQTTISLSGLTEGQEYQFQIFVNDSRNGRTSDWLTGFTDGVNSGSASITGTASLSNRDPSTLEGEASGDYIIGTFTADAVTQSFEIYGTSDGGATWTNSSRAQINGLSLQAIPEPATLGLVAAFGGAVLFIRRRFMM